MTETTWPKKDGYYWYTDERLERDHWIICKVTLNKFSGFDVEFFGSDYDTKGYSELTEEELVKLYPEFKPVIIEQSSLEALDRYVQQCRRDYISANAYVRAALDKEGDTTS